MTLPSPQIDSPVEQLPETKSAAPNLLVPGLRLVLRNWPLVLWAYVVDLAFSLLSGVPFSQALMPYLDHSTAAQRISGTLDLNTLLELYTHLSKSGFIPVASHTAVWLTVIQLLFLFIFFAGVISVYVSEEPPRFSVLLRGGIAYFWRFVRAAFAAAFISGVILGILLMLRSLLIDHASGVCVERKLFFYTSISGAVVFAVALLLRLWWDLVEVFVVRNAIDGERCVRHALLPAARLLHRNFLRAAGSFFLIGILGVAAFAFCLLLWKLLPANQVWLAGLLSQMGLFLLLTSRFWQRGMEAALVLSVDAPMIAADAVDDLGEEEEEAPVAAQRLLPALTEPTLRDLVNKLRNEPWAPPEPAVLALPVPASPEPEAAHEPKVSMIDRHSTKFPLGGPQLVEPEAGDEEKTETEAAASPEPAPGEPAEPPDSTQ